VKFKLLNGVHGHTELKVVEGKEVRETVTYRKGDIITTDTDLEALNAPGCPKKFENVEK
jgi:hypothetical protein